jgi:hypothetical protein
MASIEIADRFKIKPPVGNMAFSYHHELGAQKK